MLANEMMLLMDERLFDSIEYKILSLLVLEEQKVTNEKTITLSKRKFEEKHCNKRIENFR